MSYKIIIKEIKREEVAEKEEKFFPLDKKLDKTPLSWSAWYELDEETKNKYEGKYIETGKSKVEENEKDIYEQEVESLDVGELAIYINRSK